MYVAPFQVELRHGPVASIQRLKGAIAASGWPRSGAAYLKPWLNLDFPIVLGCCHYGTGVFGFKRLELRLEVESTKRSFLIDSPEATGMEIIQ
jgi:hypothetical protein